MALPQNTKAGIMLAILATLIWSGNFIVARSVIHDIPPVALAFLRWACASVIMIPLGWNSVRRDAKVILQHKTHLFWASLFGISVFNTMVYIAGHYTGALNLALTGTTSSPVFAFVLAAVFLREKITPLKLGGLLLCLSGVLTILSKGSWQTLAGFHFSRGDLWVLTGAFSFAIYNIIARRKPAAISPVSYVAITFWAGAFLLLPFAIYEYRFSPQPIHFNASLLLIILYLGAGASVAAFFCWNAAIARLGAARTAIFGNLIPVFSSIEAVIILREKILPVHIGGMLLVFTGVFLANVNARTLPKTPKTRINQKG